MDNETEETPMTRTKEKILFETNELVMALNTQVAVLTHSMDDLKKIVETYIQKMDRLMEKADERDATLDQRVTILRNDLTKAEGRIDALADDVKELKASTDWKQIALLIATIIAGVIGWLK